MIVRSAPRKAIGGGSLERGQIIGAACIPRVVAESLYAHWDASRIDTVIFGQSGRVAKWLDISGSGNHLEQATVAKQPHGLGSVTEHSAISAAPRNYGYLLSPAPSGRRGVMFGKDVSTDDPDITMSFPKSSEIRSIWSCIYVSNVYRSYWGPTLMGDDAVYDFHPGANDGRNFGPYNWIDSYYSAAVGNGPSICNGRKTNLSAQHLVIGNNVVCWSSSGDGVTGSRVSRDRTFKASISGIVFEYIISTKVFSYDIHEMMHRYLSAKWGVQLNA